MGPIPSFIKRKEKKRKEKKRKGVNRITGGEHWDVVGLFSQRTNRDVRLLPKFIQL